MKSDYDLVIAAKAGCKRSTQELYQRYLPLIYRRGKYFSDEQKEDFIQDCYFEMLEAINYVDFSFVSNISSWTFKIIYWNYVSNLMKKYFKPSKSYNFNEDNPIESVGNNKYTDYDRIDNECSYCSDEYFILTRFSKEQKQILNYRKQDYKISDIAKLMKKSYGWVQHEIYKAKNIAKEIIGYSFN